MTVQELIERLQELPPEIPVVIQCPETDGNWTIEKVVKIGREALSGSYAVRICVDQFVSCP